MKDNKLEVSALKDGTVIDHIPADSLFNVMNILNLGHIKGMMTFGTNLDSNRLGKKAIIKLSDVYFKEKDINKIALVAPQAKLNVIKEYVVVEKQELSIPDNVEAIVKCMNPNCITNHEVVTTKFQVVNKESIQLRCHYCEKITDKAHMEILK